MTSSSQQVVNQFNQFTCFKSELSELEVREKRHIRDSGGNPTVSVRILESHALVGLQRFQSVQAGVRWSARSNHVQTTHMNSYHHISPVVTRTLRLCDRPAMKACIRTELTELHPRPNPWHQVRLGAWLRKLRTVSIVKCDRILGDLGTLMCHVMI